jgi:hypothetical protein
VVQRIAAQPRNAAAILAQARDAAASNVNHQAAASAAQRDLERRLSLDEIRRATEVAQQQLLNDLQAIEAANSRSRESNDRILPILNQATGQDFGAKGEDWRRWWTEQLGYEYTATAPAYKPTYDQLVPFPYQPAYSQRVDCFGAGTPVPTRAGSVAIETLKIGDQVLSQDVRTGALSYQPVMVVHRIADHPTLRIDLGDEAIVTTPIHRFWRAGKGWAMARDLKPGDTLRTIAGTAKVHSVAEDRDQTVHSVEVARNRDFFVGRQAILVHDVGLVQPTPEPFDAAASLPDPVAAAR